MTQDELLEALRVAMERPETADGLTTQDITNILSISDKKALQLLRELSGQGLLEVIPSAATSPVCCTPPAYRLKA